MEGHWIFCGIRRLLPPPGFVVITERLASSSASLSRCLPTLKTFPTSSSTAPPCTQETRRSFKVSGDHDLSNAPRCPRHVRRGSQIHGSGGRPVLGRAWRRRCAEGPSQALSSALLGPILSLALTSSKPCCSVLWGSVSQ